MPDSVHLLTKGQHDSALTTFEQDSGKSRYSSAMICMWFLTNEELLYAVASILNRNPSNSDDSMHWLPEEDAPNKNYCFSMLLVSGKTCELLQVFAGISGSKDGSESVSATLEFDEEFMSIPKGRTEFLEVGVNGQKIIVYHVLSLKGPQLYEFCKVHEYL